MTTPAKMVQQSGQLAADHDAWVVAFSAVAAFAVALFAPQLFNDGDTYWHIRAGEWMLDHRSVLRSDPFSFTFAGVPWQTHEWLAEIVMAVAFRAGSWTGIALLFAAATGCAAWLLALRLSRSLSALPLLVTMLLVAGCVGAGLLARPHILALPMLVAWTAEMLDARAGERAPRLTFLVLMILWANLHGSFLVGLGLAFFFGVEAAWAANFRSEVIRSWGVFLAGAVAVCLVTPHGIGALTFPFKLLGMPELRFIREWQGIDFSTPQPLELAIIAALYVIVSRSVRLPFLRLLLLLAMLHMALQQQRQQTILAICGALMLAEPMGRALGYEKITQRMSARPFQAATLATLILFVAIAGFRLVMPVSRANAEAWPIEALVHVPAELRTKPVFNDYYFGGFLIFNGVKPFIDSRAELYGNDFIHDYRVFTAPDRTALDALRKYDIRWTFLRPDNAANILLESAPGWRRYYADPFAVVYVREGAGAP